MTLSSEEKRVLASYRIKKTKEILEGAKFNFENGRYATALNRSYYAVLNAARSLLILKGKDSASNSGVKTMLSLHYVRTGLLSVQYIDYFKILLSRRTDVDYGDFEEIDREKAEDSLKKAQEFLLKAERLINELSTDL